MLSSNQYSNFKYFLPVKKTDSFMSLGTNQILGSEIILTDGDSMSGLYASAWGGGKDPD